MKRFLLTGSDHNGTFLERGFEDPGTALEARDSLIFRAVNFRRVYLVTDQDTNREIGWDSLERIDPSPLPTNPGGGGGRATTDQKSRLPRSTKGLGGGR